MGCKRTWDLQGGRRSYRGESDCPLRASGSLDIIVGYCFLPVKPKIRLRKKHKKKRSDKLVEVSIVEAKEDGYGGQGYHRGSRCGELWNLVHSDESTVDPQEAVEGCRKSKCKPR